MGYVIKNNKNYLVFQKNTVGVTTDISKATVWREDTKAANVLKDVNHRNDIKKFKMYVAFVDTPEKKESTEDQIRAFVDKRKPELLELIKKCDRELSDLAHFAEYYTLNASEGYQFYQKTHEVRNVRRKYKEELAYLNNIGSMKSTDSHWEYKPRELKMFLGRDLSQIGDKNV